MPSFYIYIFIASLLLAVILTIIVKNIAQQMAIVDYPDGQRKIHKKAIPLLGGIALFLSYFIALYFFRDIALARGLTILQLTGFFLGALILIIGGTFDDKYNLKPRLQIIFPVLAVIIAVALGINVEKITNPSGGLINFGLELSFLISFIWLLGMMYTTKLLDGIDGLVSGLGVISGLIIFLFTITTKYYQPDVGLMALIFAGICLGFLIFNFYPAKIFLGEGGSLFIGYAIGILAIISGGKIAIALLIMGIPIMDVIWIIVRRISEGKNPFKTADGKHLHHRFLSMGLSQRQTALIYYVFAIIFGSTALFLQSQGKMIALGILIIIMVLISFISVLVPFSKKA
ncbi:MAG: MraY family glycosyltransferase [Candidatus Falkowbacteria bacterium]